MKGKQNIAIGLFTMAFFMAYGFLLIYLRDFAPEKEAWINSYIKDAHFESRLAHVHGNLFALINIVIGYLLLHFKNLQYKNLISITALIGILMPLGILSELYLGFPPIFVLIGAISIIISVVMLGISFTKLKRS